MAEQRSGAMENRKIKVKSLISVTAWAVALGMFIAYLFLKRQWMPVSYTHLTLPTN